MYGINEHGVFFAQQVPVAEEVTVSVVNKAQTARVQRRFANTVAGEAEAVAWSLNPDFTDDVYLVPLDAPEPGAALVS